LKIKNPVIVGLTSKSLEVSHHLTGLTGIKPHTSVGHKYNKKADSRNYQPSFKGKTKVWMRPNYTSETLFNIGLNINKKTGCLRIRSKENPYL
jgi:hypothetical protein